MVSDDIVEARPSSPPSPALLGGRALALYLMLVVLSGCSQGSSPVDARGAETQRNLVTVAGLPQDGITLGRLDAPATLTIYASLDDFGSGFFRKDLPPLVSRWVRPGRLRIQLRTTSGPATDAPPDPGAARAARIAQASGLQDHLWQFYGALSVRYRGYIDDTLLADALAGVGGVDRKRVEKDSRSARISNAIAKADRLAGEAKVSELPAYVLEMPGRPPTRVDGSCYGCLTKNLARYLTS